MKTKEYLNNVELLQTCIDQRTLEREHFQMLLDRELNVEPVELNKKLSGMIADINDIISGMELQRDSIISKILALKGDELGQKILFLWYVKGIRDRDHLESLLGYTKNYITERHKKALRHFESQYFGESAS